MLALEGVRLLGGLVAVAVVVAGAGQEEVGGRQIGAEIGTGRVLDAGGDGSGGAGEAWSRSVSVSGGWERVGGVGAGQREEGVSTAARPRWDEP